MVRFRFFPVALAALAAVACTVTGQQDSSAPLAAYEDPVPVDAEKANYHLLMGEMAIQRSDYGGASTHYHKAAQFSRDPTIAERASEVAATYGTRTEAVSAARRWVGLDPDNERARAALVRALIQQRDFDGVVAELRIMLDEAEDQGERRFDYVEQWLASSPDASFSSRVMQALIEDHSESARAHLTLSRLALMSSQHDLALRSVEKSLSLDPDSVEAGMLYARVLIASGRQEEGLNEARELLGTVADLSVRLEYAALLFATDNDDQARRVLRNILEDSPREPRALRALGLIELGDGNMESAKGYFSELLSTGAFPDDAVYYLATIYERNEDYPRALRFYGRVVSGANAVNAQARVARILNDLGDQDAGLKHLEAFGEAFPEHEISTVLARGQLLVEMEQADEALTLYRLAAENRPDEDRLQYAYAFLLEQQDRVEEAVVVLRKLVKNRPEDPTALNALGYTLTDRTQRHREAYRYIKQAIDITPDNPAIIDSLGWVLFHRGMNEEALEHLRRAYELDGDPEIAAHLGEVLWHSGDKEAAHAVWKESLETYPENEHLQEAVERYGH